MSNLYSVGDHVMISPDLRNFDPGEYPTIVTSMYDHAGKVCTIKTIDYVRDKYVYLMKEIGCAWNEKWLLPYEQTNIDVSEDDVLNLFE